jgi:hypothetical protein
MTMRARQLFGNQTRIAGIVAAVALAMGLGTTLASPASAEETTACTYGAGWYKIHPESVDLEIRPGVPTYRFVLLPMKYMRLMLNMSWQQILDAPPRGDAELIVAKQMIAAAMNVERNDGFSFIPEPVGEAYVAMVNHYENSIQNPLTREQLTAYGAFLAAYNEGSLGSPPC